MLSLVPMTTETMTKTTIARLVLCLLTASPAFSQIALAQNAERQLQGVSRNQNTLELRTSDGRYLIKP